MREPPEGPSFFVPDFGAPEALTSWLSEGQRALGALAWSEALEASVASHECPAGDEPGPLGRYGDPRWRTFAAAVFLADLASYPAPVDQVGFERLLYVMHVFPRGFRLWTAEVPGAGRLPVGYTGYYPIGPASFALLEREPASLPNRMVVPLPAAPPGGSFVHLFNFSIVPALRRTGASRRLVAAYAREVEALAPRGLSAITVSPDGIRVVERFGMARSGTLVVDGSEEWVYTSRR